MRVELTRLLVETGLIQFGSFNETDGSCPFRLSLEMLPAYPDVLRAIIGESTKALDTVNINRFLSTVDAVPFGVGLSLEMNIPLVYSRGSSDAAVHDFVGAYDIGHPAVLLTNALDNQQMLLGMISNAGRVGLVIHSLLSVIDFGIVYLPENLRSISLLQLPEVVSHLVEVSQLTSLQAEAVRSWLSNREHNETSFA